MWTMIPVGATRRPVHLSCRAVLRDVAASAEPALVASADPRTEARIVRVVAAIARIRSRRSTP